MKEKIELGIIPYRNLVSDEKFKTVYDFYKPHIDSYLMKFNQEIFDENYDEAESCIFVCKYIATVNGINKIIVFCENTFKVTWKVILECYDSKNNKTCFLEDEFYIIKELNNEEYFNFVIKRYKDFLLSEGGWLDNDN